MMPGSDYILHQTNDLARNFYIALGLRTSKPINFWESNDEIEKMCWAMAGIAQMRLNSIDISRHKPVRKDAKLLSIEDRINAAKSDGKVTARNRHGG